MNARNIIKVSALVAIAVIGVLVLALVPGAAQAVHSALISASPVLFFGSLIFLLGIMVKAMTEEA